MTKGSSKDFTKAVTGKISELKTRGLFVGDVRPTEVRIDSIYTYDELISVYDKYQQFLYIKHKVNPVDIYVSDAEDCLIMLFMKSETKELYQLWRKRELE